MLWCWRCKTDMPMLDEEEYQQVLDYANGGSDENVIPIKTPEMAKFARTPFLRRLMFKYEAITGYRETNPNAIWHHRISLYGPPCASCGKPLRTPRARVCAACGAEREVIPHAPA
jgi:hypothetical protein